MTYIIIFYTVIIEYIFYIYSIKINNEYASKQCTWSWCTIRFSTWSYVILHLSVTFN